MKSAWILMGGSGSTLSFASLYSSSGPAVILIYQIRFLLVDPNMASQEDSPVTTLITTAIIPSSKASRDVNVEEEIGNDTAHCGFYPNMLVLFVNHPHRIE